MEHFGDQTWVPYHENVCVDYARVLLAHGPLISIAGITQNLPETQASFTSWVILLATSKELWPIV